MSSIREIFRRYGAEYLDRYGDKIPRSHKKVIRAIRGCRTGAYGTLIYCCEDCGSLHALPCSCGNRHCPACQQKKAEEWLDKQKKKLLPCHYFLITITLPQALQRVIRSHARVGYAAMFSCAYSAIKKLTKDPRFLGSSRIAMTAVLHTWGSQLQYHPHLHIIIPGGGLTKEGNAWLPSRQDLFVHTKPLAKIIRAKMRDTMQNAGLLDDIDPDVWNQEWVVDSQAVGSGETSMRYLARYVFRVAISNNRIISYDNHRVSFQYKVSKKRKWRTMTLDAIEFIRRFLQHVLPDGFMKVRHYGFLNANFAISLDIIRNLINLLCRSHYETQEAVSSCSRKQPRCSQCKGVLRWIFFCPPFQEVMLSG